MKSPRTWQRRRDRNTRTGNRKRSGFLHQLRFENLEERKLLNADPVIGWEPPAALNSFAETDSGADTSPEFVTDSAGTWIATWTSTTNLGGTLGDDYDILFSRSTDNGRSWSDAAPLNGNADNDTGSDGQPRLVTDSAGNWIATWWSEDSLSGTIGEDKDILFARSTDNGQTWSDPVPLNTNAGDDAGNDYQAEITTDLAGNWIAVWQSYDTLDGTIGDDSDYLFSRSTDNGTSWSNPAPLNISAETDSGSDLGLELTTDSSGNWIAVWSSNDTLNGTIGDDYDVLFSHSVDVGYTWTYPAPLSENAAPYDFLPELATDSSGNWIAIWYSTESLGGTIGTDSDVLFSRLAHFNAPVTYQSSDTPKSIRDGGWWWSTETDSVLNISGTGGKVGSLMLDLSISHGDPTDLSGYLVSPVGTRVALFDRASTIPTTYYLSGDYYGQSIDGNWTLEIWDHARRDTGTLNSWLLTIATQIDNLPPTITSTPETSATEDVPYSYDVDATDPDADALTYSLDAAPTGMTIDSGSGLIQWTPAVGTAGDHSIEVQVTDGSLAELRLHLQCDAQLEGCGCQPGRHGWRQRWLGSPL